MDWVMDRKWDRVTGWAIRKGMVVFTDEKEHKLGERDVNDIIREHVREEALNDELEWNR